MKFRIIHRRTAVLLAFLAILLGIPLTAPASYAAASTGWIRLGNLSATTSAVDIYVYSSGDSSPRFVVSDVSYGTVSAYKSVSAGEYSIKMRAAGSAASSRPVLSASVTVQGGKAYTAAALSAKGQAAQLKILDDQLTTPAGKSLVRVIQASLKEHHVTVKAGTATLANDLAFAKVTRYGTDVPGTWIVHAAGGTETWSGPVKLTAGSIHTLVVLDSADGLKVTDLMDAAGSSTMPSGGAATGLGGTAPGPAPSPLPWLAGLAGGLVLVTAAGIRLRRSRAVARHAR